MAAVEPAMGENHSLPIRYIIKTVATPIRATKTDGPTGERPARTKEGNIR